MDKKVWISLIILVVVVGTVLAVAFTLPRTRSSALVFVMPEDPPLSSAIPPPLVPLPDVVRESGLVTTFVRSGFNLGPCVRKGVTTYFLAENAGEAYLVAFGDSGSSDVPTRLGVSAVNMSISVDEGTLYYAANGSLFSSRPGVLDATRAIQCVGNAILDETDGVRTIDVYEDGAVAFRLGLTWSAPEPTFGAAYSVLGDVAAVSDLLRIFVFRRTGQVWLLNKTMPEPGVRWLYVLPSGGIVAVSRTAHWTYSPNGRKGDPVVHSVSGATLGDDGTLVTMSGSAISFFRGSKRLDLAADTGRVVYSKFESNLLYYVQDNKGYTVQL